jgi:hypothetical protein
MVSQGKIFIIFPMYTSLTYSYSKCKGHGGQSCSAFEWLSNPLNQKQLGELKRLWVLHDQLGKKYGKTSPSDDLIREVLSSEQCLSTPLPTNLPTPPQTQPSTLASPPRLAGRLSKRRRSLSPTIVPRKRVKPDGNASSTRSKSPLHAMVSSCVSHEIIDLSMDSDEEDKAKGKGRAMEKKPVRAISLGKDYFELFDSDEDSNAE